MEAVEDSYLPGADLRLQVLQGNLSSPSIQAQGSVVRDGDPFAIWIAGSGVEGQEIALFFACPSSADHSRWFMAHQVAPDWMGQNAALRAVALSERLLCL